jgi:hypothetical protein
LTYWLGREERVEGPCHHFRRHARAGVAHRHAHVLARRGAVTVGGDPIQFSIAGLDGDAAAVRYGIPRIDHEVDQRGLQLTGVAPRPPKLVRQAGPHPDVLPDGAPGDVFQTGDKLINPDKGFSRD